VLTTELTEVEDELELQREFYARGWTDGLPVVIPTRERLEAFLDASGFAGERERDLGELPPSQNPTTIEAVAGQRAHGGCLPEHLGIVLAALEAMLQELYRVHIVQATTNPAAPFVLVNGPIVRRLGIACEGDALGRPDAERRDRRAIRLVMRNVGGAVAGIDHSSFGQSAKYTFLPR